MEICFSFSKYYSTILEERQAHVHPRRPRADAGQSREIPAREDGHGHVVQTAETAERMKKA